MITVKTARELLAQLPDDAQLTAYEGEGTGISVRWHGRYGWIETGDGHREVEPDRHDLREFKKKLTIPQKVGIDPVAP